MQYTLKGSTDNVGDDAAPPAQNMFIQLQITGKLRGKKSYGIHPPEML